jgi:hypothetical protein
MSNDRVSELARQIRQLCPKLTPDEARARALVRLEAIGALRDESATVELHGFTVTITRSAGPDGAVVIYVDGGTEPDIMPDGSPRCRIRLNDEPVYEAVAFEPGPEIHA